MAELNDPFKKKDLPYKLLASVYKDQDICLHKSIDKKESATF